MSVTSKVRTSVPNVHDGDGSAMTDSNLIPRMMFAEKYTPHRRAQHIYEKCREGLSEDIIGVMIDWAIGNTPDERYASTRQAYQHWFRVSIRRRRSARDLICPPKYDHPMVGSNIESGYVQRMDALHLVKVRASDGIDTLRVSAREQGRQILYEKSAAYVAVAQRLAYIVHNGWHFEMSDCFEDYMRATAISQISGSDQQFKHLYIPAVVTCQAVQRESPFRSVISPSAFKRKLVLIRLLALAILRSPIVSQVHKFNDHTTRSFILHNSAFRQLVLRLPADIINMDFNFEALAGHVPCGTVVSPLGHSTATCDCVSDQIVRGLDTATLTKDDVKRVKCLEKDELEVPSRRMKAIRYGIILMAIVCIVVGMWITVGLDYDLRLNACPGQCKEVRRKYWFVFLVAPTVITFSVNIADRLASAISSRLTITNIVHGTEPPQFLEQVIGDITPTVAYLLASSKLGRIHFSPVDSCYLAGGVAVGNLRVKTRPTGSLLCDAGILATSKFMLVPYDEGLKRYEIKEHNNSFHAEWTETDKGAVSRFIPRRAILGG